MVEVHLCRPLLTSRSAVRHDQREFINLVYSGVDVSTAFVIVLLHRVIKKIEKDFHITSFDFSMRSLTLNDHCRSVTDSTTLINSTEPALMENKAEHIRLSK